MKISFYLMLIVLVLRKGSANKTKGSKVVEKAKAKSIGSKKSTKSKKLTKSKKSKKSTNQDDLEVTPFSSSYSTIKSHAEEQLEYFEANKQFLPNLKSKCGGDDSTFLENNELFLAFDSAADICDPGTGNTVKAASDLMTIIGTALTVAYPPVGIGINILNVAVKLGYDIGCSEAEGVELTMQNVARIAREEVKRGIVNLLKEEMKAVGTDLKGETFVTIQEAQDYSSKYHTLAISAAGMGLTGIHVFYQAAQLSLGLQTYVKELSQNITDTICCEESLNYIDLYQNNFKDSYKTIYDDFLAYVGETSDPDQVTYTEAGWYACGFGKTTTYWKVKYCLRDNKTCEEETYTPDWSCYSDDYLKDLSLQRLSEKLHYDHFGPMNTDLFTYGIILWSIGLDNPPRAVCRYDRDDRLL